jgi:hypothetical protein
MQITSSAVRCCEPPKKLTYPLDFYSVVSVCPKRRKKLVNFRLLTSAARQTPNPCIEQQGTMRSRGAREKFAI